MAIQLYIATTLDGYIATEDDGLQWLFDVQGQGDNGYGDFIKNINLLIMGNRTYQWIKKAEPNGWPYPNQISYVLTHQKEIYQVQENEKIRFTDLSFLDQLNTSTQKIWLVGGGETIRYFLEKQLVDELQITVAPVLLGKGIPLFPPGDYCQKLQLLETKTYGQFVELHYLVKK